MITLSMGKKKVKYKTIEQRSRTFTLWINTFITSRIKDRKGRDR